MDRVVGAVPEAAALVPWAADKTPRCGRATAYLCVDFACREPVTDPEALLTLLEVRR